MKRYSVLHRMLSVLLCFVMVVSLFPVSVFAEGEELPVEQAETVSIAVQFEDEDGNPAADAVVIAADKGAELAQLIPFAEVEGFAPVAAAVYDSEGLALDEDSTVSVELADDGVLLSGVLEQDITVVVTYAAVEQPAEEPVDEQPAEEVVDEEIVVEAPSFAAASAGAQPAEAVENGKVATYRFITEDGTLVAEYKAVAGETVTAPDAAPSKEGMVLTGWALDGVKVALGAEITVGFMAEDTTYIYTAVYAPIVTVTFMSDGIVYHTLSVYAGYVITEADIAAARDKFALDIEAGKKLDGWQLNETAFGVGSTVETSVTVYAVTSPAQYVYFNSNGGSLVSSAEIRADGTIAKPEDPNRVGYKFVAWYTDEALTKAYDFSSQATANSTLYAKWDGLQVNYTVIYWVENANWENPYLPADKQDSDQYSYLTSVIGSGKAGTVAQIALNAQKPTPAAGFENGKQDNSDAQKVIAGNGTSIYNVYYDRKMFTVTFENVADSSTLTCGLEEHSHSNSCYICGKVEHKQHSLACIISCPGYTHTHSNTCRSCPGEHIHTTKCYSKDKVVTAKYGADISSSWPGNNWYVNGSQKTWQANIQTMPDSNTAFTKVTGKSIMQATYYVEALPGEKIDQTTQGRNFKLDHTDTAYGNSATISKEDAYDIAGFTFFGIKRNGTFYGTGNYTGRTYDGAQFFYTRNTYTVTYKYIGGDSIDVEVPYQALINPMTPAEGYKGWYLDEACSKPADAVLGGTMADKNIIVYAEKTEVRKTVKVYVGMESKDNFVGEFKVDLPITQEQLENAAKEANVALPDNSVFRGWYTLKNGVYTAYNFEDPLTEDITLYALSKGDRGSVTYLDASGNQIEGLDSASYTPGAQATAKAPSSIPGFLYWEVVDANNDMLGKAVKPGDTFTVTGNITLQAVTTTYAATELALNLNANGGAFVDGETTKTETGSKYTRVTLPTAEQVTREGYVLIGWAESADAATAKFAPGASVLLKEGTSETDTLYAVWTNELVSKSYTVKYYKDGEFKYEETITVDNVWKLATELNVVAGSVNTTNAIENAVFDHVNEEGNKTVPATVEVDGVINVYYLTDEIGPNGPDEIPDKYQITVTFKVVNGAWNDETVADITKVLTLTTNGEWDVNGTAALTDIPAAGEKPAEGYTAGDWDKEVPAAVAKANDGDIYTYIYETDVIGGTDPEDPGDDIPDKYQAEVTFAVVNGEWNNGGNANVTTVITFMKDGVPAEDGTAPLPAPEVGNAPYTGYKAGSWDADVTVAVSKETIKVLYTYTYVKDDSQTQDTKYTVKYTINGVEQTNDTVEVTGTAWVLDDPAMIKIAEGGIPAPEDKYTGYTLDPENSAYPVAGTEVVSGTVYTVNYIKDEGQTKPTIYTVKHVVGGVEQTDDEIVVKGTAWVNDEPAMIKIADGSLDKKTYEGYAFDFMDPAVVGETVVSGTIITLYYDVDEKGGTDPEQPGDNIPDKYQAFVYYVATEGGTVSKAIDAFDVRTLEEGETVSVGATATPDAENSYIFDYWTKNGEEIEAGAELTDELTVAAGDEYTYTAHFAVDVKGGTDPETGDETGDNIPDKYQAFVYYKADANGSVEAAANPTVVNFEHKNGVVTVETKSAAVAATATADTGYAFDYWDLDGANVNSGAILDTNLDVKAGVTYTYTAHFAADVKGGTDPEQPGDDIPDKYQAFVYYVADVNGSVEGTTIVKTFDTVDGFDTVDAAATATANAGYVFDHWDLDGTRLTSGAALSTRLTVEAGKEYTYTAHFAAVTIPPVDPTNPAPVDPVIDNPVIPGAPVVDLPVIPALPETINDEATPLAGPAVTVDDPMEIEDEATPLAGLHECCILHFLILCVALVILLIYMYDVKKRQKDIFEMREELAR